MAGEIKALIEEARAFASASPLGKSLYRELDKGILLVRRLAEALEGVSREMHARELHHFEEEQKSAAALAVIAKVRAEMEHLHGAGVPFVSVMSVRAFLSEASAADVIRCDYCGDALPSVVDRSHAPTTPFLQRLGFEAEKVVCPECASKALAVVDRVAAAIAKAQDADYWTDEISEWESAEDWEQEAYPENYPVTAYEDREHFRAAAHAALEAAREAGR